MYAEQTFCVHPRWTPVRRPHYDKVRDVLSPETYDAHVEAVIAEWGGLLDRDAAAMVVVDRLGRSVASFLRIADLGEGMEANLRATVVAVSPVRTFTRQDGTAGPGLDPQLPAAKRSCRVAPCA